MKEPRYEDKGMILFYHLMGFMNWHFNVPLDYIEPKYRDSDGIKYVKWYDKRYRVDRYRDAETVNFYTLDEGSKVDKANKTNKAISKRNIKQSMRVNEEIVVISRVAPNGGFYNIATIAIRDVLKGNMHCNYYTTEINNNMKLWNYEKFALKRLATELDGYNILLNLPESKVEYFSSTVKRFYKKIKGYI